MNKNTEWRNMFVPYEYFQMVTKGGAAVFQILEGDYEGYQFLRPVKLMRKDRDSGTGFSVGYTVEQELDDEDDIIEEEAETITVRLSERVENDDGSVTYETVDEEEIPADELEVLL